MNQEPFFEQKLSIESNPWMDLSALVWRSSMPVFSVTPSSPLAMMSLAICADLLARLTELARTLTRRGALDDMLLLWRMRIGVN